MNNSDDQKVNFDTEMVLEALEHHEQDLCIINHFEPVSSLSTLIWYLRPSC